jgi:hypothetical protein
VSTPFLAAFAERVVSRLIEDQLVKLDGAGAEDRATLFVANWLGSRQPGSSLLSSLEAALLACPEVADVYVDIEGLKALVDDLG